MPISAYVQSAVFFVLAAAALFGSAGTFGIAVFWVYLAILAAIFVASFLWLDPDLARERMRPGGKKPPLALRLFSGVMVLHWIIAGLDRGRFHWSDTVPLWLQVLGLGRARRQLRVLYLGDAGEPVLFLRGAHSIRPRPIRRDGRTLRGHPPSGLPRGHRRHAGQRCRARVLDRGRVSRHHDFTVSAVPRDHRGPDPSSRASRLSGLRPTRALAAHSGPLVKGSRDLAQTLNVAQ